MNLRVGRFLTVASSDYIAENDVEEDRDHDDIENLGYAKTIHVVTFLHGF